MLMYLHFQLSYYINILFLDDDFFVFYLYCQEWHLACFIFRHLFQTENDQYKCNKNKQLEQHK